MSLYQELLERDRPVRAYTWLWQLLSFGQEEQRAAPPSSDSVLG